MEFQLISHQQTPSETEAQVQAQAVLESTTPTSTQYPRQALPAKNSATKASLETPKPDAKLGIIAIWTVERPASFVPTEPFSRKSLWHVTGKKFSGFYFMTSRSKLHESTGGSTSSAQTLRSCTC